LFDQVEADRQLGVRNLGDIEVGVVIIGNDLIGLSGIEGKFK
jgi:hypothetical protein